MQVRSLRREDPLEKEMAIHSSTLAWEIPWTEETGRLQSMRPQRVGHDWVTEHTRWQRITAKTTSQPHYPFPRFALVIRSQFCHRQQYPNKENVFLRAPALGMTIWLSFGHWDRSSSWNCWKGVWKGWLKAVAYWKEGPFSLPSPSCFLEWGHAVWISGSHPGPSLRIEAMH